jgi:hypothetical protein
MDQLLEVLGHPPCADGPRSSQHGPRRCRLETPHVSLLYLRCVVPFFRLKSAHRACGVGPSVGRTASIEAHSHGHRARDPPCRLGLSKNSTLAS